MAPRKKHQPCTFTNGRLAVSAVLPSHLAPLRRWFSLAALAVLLMLTFSAGHTASAQAFTVLHNFTGGQDGASPMGGLTIDRAGNLYGTASYGGISGGNCGAMGCGSVFRMVKKNSSWILSPLYNFAGGTDGANPELTNVVLGPDGSLYGTTFQGGSTCDGVGCGTVFNLKPPFSACKTALCPWSETVVHVFTGLNGIGPVGAVVFDAEGNLFGSTTGGGLSNGGTVFELTPSGGGGWTARVIFNPYGYPRSGVIFDNVGNLYGTSFIGGNGQGSVFQLTPSGSGWIGNDLYDFTGGSDGGFPWAGLIFDTAGNLYSATTIGGQAQGGTVFQLSPSGGGWNLNTLYGFTNPNNGSFVVGPVGSLIMDNAGSLYGTALADGAYGFGSVFKLTPENGSWTYTSLHDFTGGSDGGSPYCNLVLDASGNLYGTAATGGTGPCTNGCGVVFQITP